MTSRTLARRAAAAVVSIAFLTGLIAMAASAAPAGSDHQDPKPTIVLVHGAWADASGWNGVADRLQRQGYTVIAPANPLRSVSGDAAYLNSVLSTISGPVILVGHSYGGVVITNAATGNPNVKALVYVAPSRLTAMRHSASSSP